MPVEIECDFCREKVSKSPSEVERAEHHFCNRTCQTCGRTEDDLGYTPRVHHIRPFSEFDEDEIETAHDLSNLVSLYEPY